ncbi:stage III sporulation protein AA [Sulfoacidibacillus thermotolerans]|uniref:Stage III sporulation protein AA n=1 Tax=Sulfoacidibacillus thermotolerans TaxID=1765684 RepID=A0A2U3DCK3_SULT2|nr:stage III sporulation protein AA [Sulfoacidibacillus thermotolerans]
MASVYDVASVAKLLPHPLRTAIEGLSQQSQKSIEEIRLRALRPLEVIGIRDYARPLVAIEHLRHVMSAVTGSSYYAVEAQLRYGYLTLPGGHRVGIAGRAVIDERDQIVTIRDIASIHIRVARQIVNCANHVAPLLLDDWGQLQSVLLVGPPLCGKTTVLRELARLIGNGELHPKLSVRTVSIVDERSEIAACHEGIPQFDVGQSTDVLDGCPKAQGMYMMLRSMAPQVMITDEIGSISDVKAVLDIARAGVRFIGTVHAKSLEDLRQRPALRTLLTHGAIDRFIFLSRRVGPATVERVYDRQLREVKQIGSDSVANRWS